MSRKHLCAGVLFILLLGVCPLRAQGTSGTSPLASPCDQGGFTLLVLGTYHMDNPGLDEFNVEADDVLSARRQKEIAELLERLARFQPTKIAIEAPHREKAWPERYEKYVAGRYELGRNEIEQVAFRLARQLNHSSVHPADYPMWMSGYTPNEIAPAPRPKKQETAPPAKKEEPELSEEDRVLRASTIHEFLLLINSEESIREDHRQYMAHLQPGDGPYIYQRTDLLTNWYKRNFRTFTNMMRIVEPGDRVLLIIGSGHLKILRELARDAGPPHVCLVDAEMYLK